MLIESRHIEPAMPLLTPIDGVSCSRCGDLGIQIAPNGLVRTCPVIKLGLEHTEPNAAAKIIDRATRSLMFRGCAVNPLAFDVARALSRRTTTDPAPRQTMLDRYFGWAASQRLRKFHSVIEELRSTWLLPVASRKGSPHGYWIATDEDDFKAWVTRSMSAPIKQLTTIHRVAKANFPILAEQLEFEFWNDGSVPPAVAGGEVS